MLPLACNGGSLWFQSFFEVVYACFRAAVDPTEVQWYYLWTNNHLYSPHYGSSDSTKKQQKEKAEKIQ